MTKDLTSGNPFKIILLFTLPLMLGNLFQQFYSLADTIIVGRFVGVNALAAVGATGSVNYLILGFVIGMCNGFAIPIAQLFGAHDDSDLRRHVANATWLCIAWGVVLTVVTVALTRPIMELMQTPADIIDGASTYIGWIFAGIPFVFLYNMVSAIMRALGDSKRPLYFLLAAGVVNVLLNLVFVIKLHMDVAGVALATVISQCISAALVIRCLMKETGPLRLDLKKLKIHGMKLKQIMQVGIPAGLQGVLFSLANVTVQSSINSFDDTVLVAGSSASSSVENFVYANVNAFYQANTAFTSQNFGAGNYKRILKVRHTAVAAGVLSTSLLGWLAILFGHQLLGIYSTSPDVVQAGMLRMWFLLILYGLDALMDVQVGSMRGIGYNVTPMLVSLVGACVLRLIWLATVFQIPAYHRIETVYIVYPISWIMTALAHGICFSFAYRKVVRNFKSMEESPAPSEAPTAVS